MQRKSAFMCALVLLSVLALTAVVIAADNNVGTWKLNLAKSAYRPGPAPKSQTLTIEAWGEDGVKYTADGVGAGREHRHAARSRRAIQGDGVAAGRSPDLR